MVTPSKGCSFTYDVADSLTCMCQINYYKLENVASVIMDRLILSSYFCADTYKDVEEVLLKVSGVTYEKMCRDLIIEEKICNKLIGENTLDIQHIAMNYFQQNPSVNWHNLVSILCNQFGHNRLASDVAKEHGVPYEKYCPTT